MPGCLSETKPLHGGVGEANGTTRPKTLSSGFAWKWKNPDEPANFPCENGILIGIAATRKTDNHPPTFYSPKIYYVKGTRVD